MLIGAVLLAAATPHPNSLSSSEVSVVGDVARLALRCQVASMLEVIEDLDADGDGVVAASELAAREAEIADYVAGHFLLTAGSDRRWEGGRRLAAGASRVSPDRPEPNAPPELRDWIRVEIDYRADARIRDLLVDMTLFRDTSPDHLDACTIRFEDGETAVLGLGQGAQRGRVDPYGGGALAWFARIGLRHGLRGWEHLAFALALVLVSPRPRALAAVVLAFVLGHLTAASLAAEGVLDVGGRLALWEAGFALSVAYLAADRLIDPGARRARWPEAAAFGALHGLGQAGYLGPALADEGAPRTALVGFHVGLALATVLAAAAAALVGRVVLSGRGAWRERVVRVLALGLLGLGVAGFFARLR